MIEEQDLRKSMLNYIRDEAKTLDGDFGLRAVVEWIAAEVEEEDRATLRILLDELIAVAKETGGRAALGHAKGIFLKGAQRAQEVARACEMKAGLILDPGPQGLAQRDQHRRDAAQAQSDGRGLAAAAQIVDRIQIDAARMAQAGANGGEIIEKGVFKPTDPG